jgi:hypothetical protein
MKLGAARAAAARNNTKNERGREKIMMVYDSSGRGRVDQNVLRGREY